MDKTAKMTSEQRGDYLENPPEDGPDIDKAHEVVSTKALFKAVLNSCSKNCSWAALPPCKRAFCWLLR